MARQAEVQHRGVRVAARAFNAYHTKLETRFAIDNVLLFRAADFYEERSAWSRI